MTVTAAAPSPADTPPAGRLVQAVDALLAQPSVELTPMLALEQLSTVLTQTGRLTAVVLDGIGDLDRRELYALDGAGSAASWLRARKVGGQPGQVSFTRRLAQRPVVHAALAGGRVSSRAAGQVCAALDAVPDTVPEPVLLAVLTDGVDELLREACGGLPPEPGLLDELRRAALTATTSSPAERLEPALLLLADHVAPALLGRALGYLHDALLPDEHLERAEDAYDAASLDLHELLDGRWHTNGLLDPETGGLLAAHLTQRQAPPSDEQPFRSAAQRRVDALRDLLLDLDPPTDQPTTDSATAEPADEPGLFDQPAVDIDADTELDPAAEADSATTAAPQPGPARRTRPAGTGTVQLTVLATLATVLGLTGALPGRLGGHTSIPARTVQRLGCGSALAAVLLDDAGHPLTAGGTHRHATRRERRALHARWGPACAVDGCHRPGLIPHHVIPWWLAARTHLEDLIPICTTHHHDIHEGGRTLRLRDGRHITPTGWDQPPAG